MPYRLDDLDRLDHRRRRPRDRRATSAAVMGTRRCSSRAPACSAPSPCGTSASAANACRSTTSSAPAPDHPRRPRHGVQARRDVQLQPHEVRLPRRRATGQPIDVTQSSRRAGATPPPRRIPRSTSPARSCSTTAQMDVGVPLTDVAGAVKLDATVRQGHLETLRGDIDFGSMKMAGRPVKDFRAELFKPAGKTQLHLNKMRGDIADGVMSGRDDARLPGRRPVAVRTGTGRPRRRRAAARVGEGRRRREGPPRPPACRSKAAGATPPSAAAAAT